MIRVALSGDRGRMGKSLQKLIKKSKKFTLAAGANKDISPLMWKDSLIDGVIDFSLPELFIQSLKWSVEHKKPFVSGTTGLSPSQKKALKRASQSIPVFYGENMSGGIFLLSQWLQDLFYRDVEIFIEDVHHKDKKDKPSGTALRLAGSLSPFLKKHLKNS